MCYMPSKRMSKRLSRKVRKTSKQVRRSSKSMKGGAKRRTSKRSSKCSSKCSSKRAVKKISRHSQKAGGPCPRKASFVSKSNTTPVTLCEEDFAVTQMGNMKVTKLSMIGNQTGFDKTIYDNFGGEDKLKSFLLDSKTTALNITIPDSIHAALLQLKTKRMLTQ